MYKVREKVGDKESKRDGEGDGIKGKTETKYMRRGEKIKEEEKRETKIERI